MISAFSNTTWIPRVNAASGDASRHRWSRKRRWTHHHEPSPAVAPAVDAEQYRTAAALAIGRGPHIEEEAVLALIGAVFAEA
jgi:hypothetical protein